MGCDNGKKGASQISSKAKKSDAKAALPLKLSSKKETVCDIVLENDNSKLAQSEASKKAAEISLKDEKKKKNRKKSTSKQESKKLSKDNSDHPTHKEVTLNDDMGHDEPLYLNYDNIKRSSDGQFNVDDKEDIKVQDDDKNNTFINANSNNGVLDDSIDAIYDNDDIIQRHLRSDSQQTTTSVNNKHTNRPHPQARSSCRQSSTGKSKQDEVLTRLGNKSHISEVQDNEQNVGTRIEGANNNSQIDTTNDNHGSKKMNDKDKNTRPDIRRSRSEKKQQSSKTDKSTKKPNSVLAVLESISKQSSANDKSSADDIYDLRIVPADLKPTSDDQIYCNTIEVSDSSHLNAICHNENKTPDIIERNAIIENEGRTCKSNETKRIQQEETMSHLSPSRHHVNTADIENNSIVGLPKDSLVNAIHQSAEEISDFSRISCTLKKGILWQQQNHNKFHERIFNRWKERYFILTNDYLACFKKSTKVGHSEMGGFLYKAALVDVTNLKWADKKKDGVICLHISGSFSLLLWTNQGLDEWMYLIKDAVDGSKGRREILIRKTRTLSSATTSSPSIANNCPKIQSSAQEHNNFCNNSYSQSNPGTTIKSNPALQEYANSNYVQEQSKKSGHKSTNAFANDSLAHGNNNAIETNSSSNVCNSESILPNNVDATNESIKEDCTPPEGKDHDRKLDALSNQKSTANAIVRAPGVDSEITPATTNTSMNDVQRLNQFQPFEENKRQKSHDEEGGSSKKNASSNQQDRATPSASESSSASLNRSKQQSAHSAGSKTSSAGLAEESPSHKNNDLEPLNSPILRRQPASTFIRHKENALKERSASQEASTSYNSNISSVNHDLLTRNGTKVSPLFANKQQQPNSRPSPRMNRLKSLQHQYHSEEGPLMLRTINQTDTSEADRQAIKLDSYSPPTSNVLSERQQHLTASSYQSQDSQLTKMLSARDNNFQPLVKRNDSWQSLSSLTHVNKPTPKSLQVSPALAERSLYAQHLMDSAESTRTSGYNTASSSKGILRLLQSVKSKQRTSNEHCDVSNNQQSMQRQSSAKNDNNHNNTKANILLHHQNSLSRFIDNSSAIYTLSNQNMLVPSNANPYGDYSSARSALKSATSEFSFIRPNSPMLSTLPHSSRSMQFKQQMQQQQHKQDLGQDRQHYHKTIPEQHILTVDGQHKTTILTNENLGVLSSRSMDPQHTAHVSLPPMVDANLGANESNAGDFLAPPSRELPMKPNQKRASKKSMQKSSSLSSSIANFFGKAFTRSRSSSRKQSRNKTGTALHNKDNIVVGIFDETNLSYAPIMTQQNSISNHDSDKSICPISNHQQVPPFQQQQPQKMVDMIKAFTDQTMPNGQDDLIEEQQQNLEVQQHTIETHQNPPTLTANLEKHRSHYSRPQAIAEFAASIQSPNSTIINPAISNNKTNRILMSPLHKSNSVIAGSGSNLAQIDLINGLLDHRSSYNPMNMDGCDKNTPINAANSNFAPRSSYDRSPVSYIRRHPTVCSPSRPSSIYGQPSLVSQPGPLMDRPFFGNHRNSLHQVRDGTGNLVMMMPSLGTTREVAENVASPTSPIKSPIKQANSSNNIKISNHGHYDHGSSNHLDHIRRSSQIDPTNCAVVSPFHQSPTLNNIYDNHPGLMKPPDNFLYDNQASLYISSKVSDSMPSHLFMAATSNNNNNNNISNNNFNSIHMHNMDSDPYRRTSHYLPGSVNLPGSRQSSASIHEANLHRNSQSNITANMIKPSAIVTPNSPKSHYQHHNDYQIPSNNAPIMSSLDHQIYKPSTSRSLSPGIISPLVGRRNSNYQQSPLVTRSTQASDHVSISPSINLVGAPGVKLDPNLAASLLVTPNGLRTDLIDNTMMRNQNIHSGASHNVNDSNDARNKTFLVSTRLTKSLASANNHVSTPTRYLPQQKHPGTSTDRFFASEAVNATPIKSQPINQGSRNIGCLIQNGQSTRILAASISSSSSSSSSNRQRNCSSTETSSSETSGSLSNGSRISSSDDNQQRSVNKKNIRLNANIRNKINYTSNDLTDDIGSQNTGTDSSSAASSTRYNSNTRSGSVKSDALSASDSLDDRAWVTSKLVESHLETNDDQSANCLKLSGYTNKRCTSLTQSEKDLLEGAIS